MFFFSARSYVITSEQSVELFTFLVIGQCNKIALRLVPRQANEKRSA